MSETRTLSVIYKDRIVGRLAEMSDRRIAFQYSDEWLKKGFAISPLSLPLREGVFVPNERSRDRFSGLFGVFADSLPDSWGELLLDRYLGSLGIRREDVSTLDRLAYTGRAGMGALEYLPAREKDFNFDPAGLNYDKIATECEKILSSQESDKLDLIFKIAGSSGGTRPKILLSEKGKEYIVKFPAKKDPVISGKREYDYSLCAKKCGIEMTETGLIPSSLCDGYFKTRRFDRQGRDKIFTVTFAGLLEADFRAPSCDYATFYKLVGMLTRGNKHDAQQMYKIMCFNVLTHNRDDHTKNFSFIYTDDSGWRLAPAYDLTYSDTYWGEQTTSINGKGKDIKDKDMIDAGKDAGLSEAFCKDSLDDIKNNIKDILNYINGKNKKSNAHVSFEDRVSEFTGRDM